MPREWEIKTYSISTPYHNIEFNFIYNVKIA